MIGLPAALLVVGGAASLVKLGAYRAPAVEPRATPTVMQTSAESANSAPGIAASGHDDATPLPTAPSASSTVAEPASERTSESAEQRAASPRPASQPSTPKRARAAGARASTAHATTASSATAHATKPVGRLDLAVSPWGEIYVDGRKRGLSPPLSAIKLPPGRHTIEIRNAAFAPYTETVNLEANASVKLRHKFR
jgi:serine/threonine-protein kinase